MDRFKKGFTLIEILIVAAIIGVIATAAIGISVKSRRTTALDRASKVLVAEIRDIQQMALTSRVFQGRVPCGYVITSNDSRDDMITVFAEIRTSCDDAAVRRVFDPLDSAFKKIKEIEISEPEYVKIEDLSSENKLFLDIFFEPPESLAYFDGERPPVGPTEVTIRLCLRQSCASSKKDVVVSVGGPIMIK